MTLGTGYLSSAKRRDTGLISRHDYSVLGEFQLTL